ncbi:MAG: nuclear transport factor 2 family protein [Chitinophagaceae bacterium]
MKKLFFLSLVFLISLSTITAQTNDEKQVAAAVEKLKQALLDGKKGPLEAITADELTYGHSNGRIEDKKAFVLALTSGASDFVTIEFINQTMKVSGNTAWVRHTLNATNLDGGVSGVVKLSVLLVWQKRNGAWKLFARQAVKILPA